MKTIELKKLRNIARKLKNYNYKTYTDVDPPKAVVKLRRYTSEQPNQLFLLKDLDKLDNYNAVLHHKEASGGYNTTSHPVWWQNKSQWLQPGNESKENVESASISINPDDHLQVTLNLPQANSTNSIASRFEVEKLSADIV